MTAAVEHNYLIPAPQQDYFMTAQEVADEQRIAVETLYHWRAAGEGPRSTKRGRRRIVYKRSDVDAWVAEQEALTSVGGTVGQMS